MGLSIWQVRGILALAAGLALYGSVGLAAEPEVKPATPSKQTYSEGGPKPGTPTPEWADEVKHPADWLTWGADLRLRQEFINNAMSFNDSTDNEMSFQRYRSRVWGSILPADNMSLNNRWVWEPRYWFEPDSREGWDESNIICDQLNLQIKDLSNTKSTLTVGRQDIILLDGWLLLDGTPLDGSRTIFFDAVRYQYQIPHTRSSLDMAVLQTHSNADDWSPMFLDDEESRLVEQDEFGVYVDYRFTPSKTTQFDAYGLYKNNDPQQANGDDGEVYTLGGRAEHFFDPHIRGRVEGAYQFGNRTNSFIPSTGDVQAWGATSKLSYLTKDQWNDSFHLNAEYLSGDKPGTETNEAFDPLWGRWPQWSELYVYTDAPETRIAQTTNLMRIGPSWDATPTNKLSLGAAGYALFADQRTNAPSAFFGDGYYRGTLFQTFARYKFNRFVAGHLWGEYLIPGSFYAGDDNAVYLRAELNFTF